MHLKENDPKKKIKNQPKMKANPITLYTHTHKMVILRHSPPRHGNYSPSCSSKSLWLLFCRTWRKICWRTMGNKHHWSHCMDKNIYQNIFMYTIKRRDILSKMFSISSENRQALEHSNIRNTDLKKLKCNKEHFKVETHTKPTQEPHLHILLWS